MNRKSWTRVGLALALLLVAAVAGGMVVSATGSQTGKLQPPILAAPAAASPLAAGPAGSYAAIIKPALPEVVNISSSRIVRNSGDNPMAPFFNDPFFRHFFGDRMPHSWGPREQREQSLGSGVIVGSNGYILTNSHVVDGASEVKVYLRDKREFQARIVGTDPKTDIAVLKVDANNLPAIPLGDSTKVQIGDVVFAIGDPFGIGQTVTMGIVGATGRGNLGIEDYEDFIQTDAAINPGNSGGALIDTRGELVGINTAILSRSGGNQGVGFAIPVNLARSVMDQIVEHGKVVRGWLGAVIQNMTPAMAKAFGLQQSQGVLIGDIVPNGPAAHAGLAPGDVILEINGAPVEDSSSLRLQISQTAPGTTVHLKIRSGAQTRDVAVTLGELPSGKENASGANSGESTMPGMSVDELTPDVRQQLDLPPTVRGVVVTGVAPAGAAAAAGIREGDVIQEVNRQPVTNVPEYEQAIRRAGANILLRVFRDGSGFYVALEAQ